MQLLRRLALGFVAVLASGGLLSRHARADVLYSVTNLGPAANSGGGPGFSGEEFLTSQNALYTNGNYLPALSSSQQASFQAGSFDVYAHPATQSLAQDTFYENTWGPMTTVDNGASYWYIGVYLTTSNNVGGSAGSAVGEGGAGVQVVATTFQSDPSVISTGYPYTQQIQNPGNLGPFQTPFDMSHYLPFYGVISGLNDHSDMVINELTFDHNTAIVLPNILVGKTDTETFLGTLGGANGAAYALNNSNQVVGWSQTASGAQHAFLWSNGTMQDLNLLIPPLTGITLTSAVGINAAGEIVAFGTDSSGQTNEYLLDPVEATVPEPGALAVMGIMILAFAGHQAHSRRASRAPNAPAA